MAGLFGGLFGKKSQDAAPTAENGFYLEGEDARSLGDGQRFVNMEPVKKSFPKTLAAEQTNGSTPKVTAQTQKAVSTTVSAALTGSPLSSETLQRRRADSSLDMYRNMARDLKKS